MNEAIDPTQVLEKAADHSWEALMVAFLCITVVGMLVWLMRSWMADAHSREDRMAKRIDDLETFTRDTLLIALRDNNKALAELTQALHGRLCLLRPELSNPIVHSMADTIADVLGKKEKKEP